MPHLVATALTGAALAVLPAVPAAAAPVAGPAVDPAGTPDAPAANAPSPGPRATGGPAAGPRATGGPAAGPRPTGGPVPQARAANAPRASLRLTLTHPGQEGVAPRSVTLLCEPVGGTHPEAERACEELSGSQGVIGRSPSTETACTMIYAPVIAEAQGHWHGRPVRFRAEYGNDCVLAANTGSIFRF